MARGRAMAAAMALALAAAVLTGCVAGDEMATLYDRDAGTLYGGQDRATPTPPARSYLRPDYRASNNAELYRIERGTFTVRAAVAEPAAFWCAAGEFAALRLGVAPDAPIWRISPVGEGGFAVQGGGLRQIIPGPGQIFRTHAGDPAFLSIDNALGQIRTVADARGDC